MRLIIAEKPSVAQAIAGVIGGDKREGGHINCSQAHTRVTWCFGHLLKQARPEDYAGGQVLASHLPIIPRNWKLSPRDGGAGKQIKVIRELLNTADEVVNAGDADREGQLLVDEVLLFLNWKGKTSRLWLSSLDDESVRRALVSLKNNDALRPLYESALARQRADWLMGMNASIALSRNLQACGVQGAWSVGRVQTPTLALLVDRQRDIQNFKPRDHYQVQATLDGDIRALWQIPEDLQTDDGLLLDKSAAETCAQAVQGQRAIVSTFTRKAGERQAPMPYVLSTLQKTASSRLGLSAKDTLAAAQELYEAKLATYPRSDCPWLPVEMHAAAAQIIRALGAAEMAGIDPERRHPAWNTAKVEAHHGIIPTRRGLAEVSGLSENAKKIYGLLRESYLRLFMSPETFETREALFTFPGAERFKASARIVQEPGWTQLGQADNSAEDDETGQVARLPILTEGQQLACESAQVLAKRTSPPKPYTDGTLIAAMTGVHKLVTDPKLKARLKETSGLGTEATRASMIEVLIAREYAERKKKEIHPTDRGVQLIDMLRKVAPDLADPGTTALQEDALAAVASGRTTFDTFMSAQLDAVRESTKKLLYGQFGITPANFYVCQACGGSGCAQRTSKAGTAYHRCLDCGAAFADDAGKPGKRFEDKPQDVRAAAKAAASGPNCPSCEKSTFKSTTRTGKRYYRCSGCKSAWWPDREDEGKLGTKWEDRK